MTSAVSRRIPPQRLVTLMNPVVRLVLRSPLHRLVDGGLILLHVTGRRSGRRYDIPVGYVDVDGTLVVVTQHGWRGNVRGGAEVGVTREGVRRTMHADLGEEPAAVAAVLHAVIDEIGWQAAGRRIGLTVEVGRAPTRPELEAAVREFGLATVTLTPR
jgi:hypothetical protein